MGMRRMLHGGLCRRVTSRAEAMVPGARPAEYVFARMPVSVVACSAADGRVTVGNPTDNHFVRRETSLGKAAQKCERGIPVRRRFDADYMRDSDDVRRLFD